MSDRSGIYAIEPAGKIGVLVLGAKAPKILGRVLKFFDDPRFRFFLHVDRKIDLAAYLNEVDAPGRVSVVAPRINVFWGGFSMIEAELSLIRAALAEPDVSGLVLWSDDCAPLKSPDAVYRALVEAPDRIAREWRDYTQEWYWKFHFPDSNFTSMIKHLDGRSYEAADWENIQKLERARQRGKKKLTAVFFSRQWWALSRASAETMLRRLDEDEHLLESFRYSMFADETLFATLHQLCFPDVRVPDVPMYADYDRPPVPFHFTRPHELPDLGALAPHYLFIRKIWPWAVDVVDRVMKDWVVAARAVAPVVAPVAATALPTASVQHAAGAGPALVTGDDEAASERALAAAIEARDDGELEESATLFEQILARRPGDPQATLHYAMTLKKQRRLGEADRVLETAMALAPDHARLRHDWAEVPATVCDHDEVVRRGRVYRNMFPPSEHRGWDNLATEFGSLSEALRWDDLAAAVTAQRANAVQHGQALRICLWQAAELCLLDEQKILAAQARGEAWGHLPQEAKGNVRLRVEMAELNQQLRAEAGVRLISIGQNCLPFLVGGRWGLLPAREKPEETTPFDRGAFLKDTAAAVIENDFASFLDRDAYVENRSWDQQRMYRHDATGVYFYHERGVFWFEEDGNRFFSHVAGLIETWRQVSTTGRRLFVFCLCGEGDLARLVDVVARRLLGPDVHLLVVDVLQQPHDCPAHDRVTYLHLPYPAQYVWDSFNQQSEARGVEFELSVMIPMMDHMLSYLPPARVAFYRRERLRILQFYARAAVTWRHDHPNGAALFGPLHRLMPADRETALSYARALRNVGRVEEARAVLAVAAADGTGDYELQAAWAEAGVAPFDWVERLARLRVLRGRFPPAQEPRSWETLAEELKILTNQGAWDEATALIAQHGADFRAVPDLLQTGLDTLIQLGWQEEARRLLEAASPAARAALSGDVLDGLAERLDEAEVNTALVRRADARVLVLGQNLSAGLVVTRWGLRAEPRAYDALTPFEVGDFFEDTAADAIDDDLAALSRQQDYKESLAWGGGVSPRHQASGVTFMMHRAARLGPAETARFGAHLDAMVAHWRRQRGGGRQVYVYFFSEKGDPALLVAAAKARLLGHGAKLVIIDQHEEATPIAAGPDVVVVHAPPPRNYAWFSALKSATPENLNYERRVLAPVIEVLEEFASREVEALVTAPGG